MSFSGVCSSALAVRVSRNFSSAGKLKTDDGELQAMELLHNKGIHVSEEKLRRLLARCTEKRDLAYQRRVHTLMVSTRLDEVGILGDHLIRNFAYSGSLLEGTLAFCKVVNPSVHTWHAIMCAQIMLGDSSDVFLLYQMMQEENMQPNKFVFSCILNACGNTGSLVQGKLIHEHIIRNGAEIDVVMGSVLIDMYIKCGDLITASEIFNCVPKSIVSYNVMLAGLVEQKQNAFALVFFREIMVQCFELSVVTLLSVLKACSGSGSLRHGKIIHDLCANTGIESDASVGSALIDMYHNCKSLEDASGVFEALPAKNIVSWNALISACSQEGCEHLAFEHFQKMQKLGIKPDVRTFSSILIACRNTGAVRQGDLVYKQLIRSGVELDTVVGNTLVDMYGKCGRLEDAHNIFSQLPCKNIVTWNTLVSVYVQHGMDQCAVQLFESMQRRGVKANNITLSCVLSACSRLNDLGKGRALHDYAVRNEWSPDLVVGNALIDMYGKCGSFEDSFQVLHGLPFRNVVSWNALIAGQVLNLQSPTGTLDLFMEMIKDNVEPNDVTLLSLLKYCGSLGYVSYGMMLHLWIINHEIKVDVPLGNVLVDMYTKCGCLHEACNVFYSMKSRDTVSWSTLITGYAQHECAPCAVRLFSAMRKEGIEPNALLLLCVLRACGSIKDIQCGRLIHGELAMRELDTDTYVANSLVDMYVKCQDLESATAVFNKLPARDLVTWNALIAGYAEKGFNHHALGFFKDLHAEDLLPNERTFSCILNMCASKDFLDQGRLIHGQVCESDHYADAVIGNTLVHMYCKCGTLDDARSVLDQFKHQDVVAWNTMLAGYVEQGCGALANELFEKMQERGVRPDSLTFACLLKACSSSGSKQQGTAIHEKIARSQVSMDSVLGNSLVDMYMKCGALEEAVGVFAKLCCRDTVSYNTMISGCAQQDQGFFALEFFEEMQREEIKPDKVTFLSTIKASGSVGAVRHGKWMHDQVLRQGLDADVAIGNTLIVMYGTCGWLAEANHSFIALPDRNVVSWSALITEYSQHGYYMQAGQCLEEMQRQGLKPVDMIFTSMLSALSHEGMVEQGHELFEFMKETWSIEPSIEHYNCMLQLLASAGHLQEAESMLRTMPIAADTCSWMTLLIACRAFGVIRWEKCTELQVARRDIVSCGGTLQLPTYSSAY